MVLLTMGEEIIINILKENDRGLTITELVRISKLPRSVIRIILAKLEGAEKLEFRRIGMAKVYSLKSEIQRKLIPT